MDALAAKFSPSGAMLYSTYMGGSAGLGSTEGGIGIVVDASGSFYITGTTDSDDFPTMNAYQDSHLTNSAAFITKFSPDGLQLVFSTYLSGTDGENAGVALALDANGDVFVAGQTNSSDFPTVQATQEDRGGTVNFEDAFVAEFSPDGQTLLFSTYLGGGNTELTEGSLGISFSAQGNLAVAGTTFSNDFPVEFAYQPTNGGTTFPAGDAFLVKYSFAPVVPEAAAPAIYFYQTETPTLTWSPVSDAVSYHIQVDSSPTFASPLEFDGTVDGSLLSVLTSPLRNGLHYWRVQARHKNGTFSYWSAVQTFFVRA
jgi:hypothetical protein